MRSQCSRWLLLLAVSTATACTTTPAPSELPSASRQTAPAVPETLRHVPLDPASVRVTAETLPVEDHWLLHFYDSLRPPPEEAFRIEFPGSEQGSRVAHLLLPAAPGPHPALLILPIRGGDHLVSEMLAHAFARRGYAALRLERSELFIQGDAALELPAERMAAAVRDARRLLDWLSVHPRIDPDRIGTAGVSLGGILAATLMGVDERVRAGFFALAGGGLGELLYESSEPPVRAFRERVSREHGVDDRERFVALMAPHTGPLDPVRYAGALDPRTVLLVSGRFDRVVPPARTRALWEALGRPTWHQLPTGHYQAAPFLWWAAARGADHFERWLAPGIELAVQP